MTEEQKEKCLEYAADARGEYHTCNGGEPCVKCDEETCEHCGELEAKKVTIQRTDWTLCDKCFNNVPMGEIQAKAHVRAVEEGDIDCKPMCGVCREYAHDLQDLTHEKT